jgi:hypothetical protein
MSVSWKETRSRSEETEALVGNFLWFFFLFRTVKDSPMPILHRYAAEESDRAREISIEASVNRG